RMRLRQCELDAQCVSTHAQDSAWTISSSFPLREKAKIQKQMNLRLAICRVTVFSISALLLRGLAFAQTSASEEDAIKKTALDYIAGWYTGDAARMERALHPELAKRMISTDPQTGRSQFSHMGAMTLVQRTREGVGKKIPPDRQQKEVTILDRYNNAAVVK